MGRLQVARPAAALAARCAPTSRTSLGLPRLWQHCAAPVAARPTVLRRQFRSGPSDDRQPHPSARDPEREAEAGLHKPLGLSSDFDGGDHGVVSWNKWSVKIRPRSGKGVMMDALWLRDACPCPRCVDPDSGQKTFATTDLPDYPRVERAFLNAEGGLEVTFEKDELSGGQSHQSVFPPAEVRGWTEGESGIRGSFASTVDTIPWDRSTYLSMTSKGACRISYKDWIDNDSAAFWAAFSDLAKTGLIIVTDVPLVEDEVERVAKAIGPIQYTFYGWTWDVKSKPQAENVAYTSQFLGLHQDLMYHTPIPKIQLLHCLENSCEGGESLFSHGVRAAHELRLTEPEHYQTLVNNTTHFHYQKNGHHYYFRHPTIDETVKGYPSTTYWAPPFQTTFRKRNGTHFASLREWKQAATAFQQLVESPRNMVEMKLQPGECVIFDNRRVLHGRRAFAAGGGGSRWLKGTYIEPQVFYAKETVLAQRLNLPPYSAQDARDHAVSEAMMVRKTMPEEMQDVAEEKMPVAIETEGTALPTRGPRRRPWVTEAARG